MVLDNIYRLSAIQEMGLYDVFEEKYGTRADQSSATNGNYLNLSTKKSSSKPSMYLTTMYYYSNLFTKHYHH